MTIGTPREGTATTVLILVRHGETLGNREGRYQSQDTPLSDTGRLQAARLAERIAAEHAVQALYSSDLARAMETARIVGARIGLDPHPQPALRELDVGDLKGQLRSEALERYPGGFDAWLATGGVEPLPGESGECCDDVARRTMAAIREIVARHPGECVLVVSHGLALGILLGEINGWDRSDTLTSGRALQRNTAVNIVEVDPSGERRCTLIGCVAHLADSSPTPWEGEAHRA
jgi:broad specificity phosphatase PhoE